MIKAKKQFYVYLHCVPNGDPFYVGKGQGKRSHNLTHRSAYHKSVSAKYGVEILVFPRSTEKEAIADEIRWIKTLREAGMRLVNLTDGGDGTSGWIPSQETREKLSAANKGRVITPEWREKMSKAHKERPHSEQHRANLAAANARPEVREKRSIISTGRTPSAETRMKLSAKLKGRVFTDETRAKMAASAKVKTFTVEHRMHISESCKGRVVTESQRVNYRAAALKREALKREAQNAA